MKSYITGDDVANEARMTRSAHQGSILILEGDTDSRVYKRFLNGFKCKPVIGHGKPIVLKALEILEKNSFDGVLAIVDSDFWALDGTRPSGGNLFVTDTHDLESMMLKSTALSKVLDEYGSAEKIRRVCEKQGKEIRAILLESCMWIGYLRWHSEKKRLSLKFSGLSFASFVDSHSLMIDPTKVVRTVKNKSGRHDLDETEMLGDLMKLSAGAYDPWHVCCGDDLLSLLSISLRRLIGSQKAVDVKPKSLCKALRLAYEHTHFIRTSLYGAIRNWEQRNEPYTVLTPEQAN